MSSRTAMTVGLSIMNMSAMSNTVVWQLSQQLLQQMSLLIIYMQIHQSSQLLMILTLKSAQLLLN
ncbi:hypothetical protein BDDG_11530 [Blastomyces dermatitidis ATCC 18188]|uniref:Uncharacterized protein n=1 Tax=Ajellomyces dermatitidis (strain ATCC 18188 / CBS 674.68) TaxID=653446 RepID=A0A0J9EJ27_AJEDA|nr:hypothetical protein BDDG_11530 [Blastomyces dermatitidis ATCC 18188]